MPGERNDRAPTMRDVAAITGFSPQTVHRSLHASEKVDPETRSKILKVVKEIGYRPNRAARHLATAKSSILGIVSFATQIYGPAHTILSIDEVAKALGLNIMLTTVPSLWRQRNTGFRRTNTSEQWLRSQGMSRWVWCSYRRSA